MASTYTGLGVQLMATGEKAGTWGTLTNTNWNIMEQISGGYVEQSIAGGAQTTTLSVSDGSAGAVLAHRVIKFTGSITGNQIVTIPLDVQTFYIILNGTTDGSGTPTVQFKYASGSGSSVTWAASDKGTKIIYATADDGTNPNIVDVGMGTVTLTGTETLTNKTLTSPKIGTNILDTNGLQLLNLTATGSAVNELTLANAAKGNAPILSATGNDTNIGITLTPKGSGAVKLDLLTFPTVTGAADQVLTSNGSGQLSFVDNSGGIAWQAVKTSATFTAVAGEGYFINTTSNAIEMDLPAGSIGDEIAFIDYAGTFDTNALTIDQNGTEKILGSTSPLTVSVERAANTLVYTDGTQGWLLKNK